MKKRITAFLLTLILAFSLLCSPAFAETAAASTLRLVSYTGTVKASNASGKAVTLRENLRLYSGYCIETGEKSYAYISLDDNKAVKLDANSSCEISKSGKKLEIRLNSGKLLFDVSAPVAKDESLNIRTSTMVTGVRGTAGWVEAIIPGYSAVYLLEGKLSVYGADPETGAIRSVEIVGGEMAYSSIVSEESGEDNRLELEKITFVEETVPGFVAVEISENEALAGKITDTTSLDVDLIINDSLNKLSGDEESCSEELAQIAAEAETVGAETVAPVFTDSPAILPLPSGNTPEQPEVYTVTWLNYDGTVLETDTEVEYGSMPSFDGNTPVKPSDSQGSYSFSGWTPEPSSVSADVSYTAVFDSVPAAYTVTWLNYDGTVLETDTEVEYGSMPSFDGNTPVKPSDSQVSYSFSGWTPELSSVSADVSYTAVFDSVPAAYTVTWLNYDGTVLETDTDVEYGSMPSYDSAIPERPENAQYSFTFTGWGEFSAVTADVSYTADFDPVIKTYSVTWTDEDGTILRIDTDIEYGSRAEYGSADPVKAEDESYSYVFCGWFDEKDDTLYTDMPEIVGDTVYQAQYKILCCNVVLGDGLEYISGTDLAGKPAELPDVPKGSTVSFRMKADTGSATVKANGEALEAVGEEYIDNEYYYLYELQIEEDTEAAIYHLVYFEEYDNLPITCEELDEYNTAEVKRGEELSFSVYAQPGDGEEVSVLYRQAHFDGYGHYSHLSLTDSDGSNYYYTLTVNEDINVYSLVGVPSDQTLVRSEFENDDAMRSEMTDLFSLFYINSITLINDGSDAFFLTSELTEAVCVQGQKLILSRGEFDVAADIDFSLEGDSMLTVSEGASLRLTGGKEIEGYVSLHVSMDSSIINNGSFYLCEIGRLFIAGTFTNNASLENCGEIFIESDAVFNNKGSVLNKGTINHYGRWNNLADAEFTNDSGTLINNNGSFSLEAPMPIEERYFIDENMTYIISNGVITLYEPTR